VRVRVGMAVVVVFGVAGCAGTPRPQPVPSSSAAVTSVAPTSRGPVPSVPRRLDMSGHLANPCELLTKEDLTALGFKGEYVVVPSNPGVRDRRCEVGGGSGGGLLHLTLSADVSPLPEAYASTPETYEFFQAREIVGFPAVELGRSATWPGACAVRVGTAEGQGITLDHNTSSLAGTTQEMCDRLLAAATAVMRRLGA
jgi:hypothetical protein